MPNSSYHRATGWSAQRYAQEPACIVVVLRRYVRCGVQMDAPLTDDGARLIALLDVLTDMPRNLLRDYEVTDILDELTRRTPDILPVDGAGVMIEDESGVLRFTAASDDTVRYIESLQIELGEGPCLAAYQTGEQVLLDDLSTTTLFRAFAPRALENRLHAVYSFPMWHDGQSLGALNLYRITPAALTLAQTATGQTLADVPAD